jgi:hypothetical protein
MITGFFRARTTPFRTRSVERDQQSDAMNIARVADALDAAIRNFRIEHEGLSQRLADVTSRAAIVAGNGSDDYLEREQAVSDRLRELDNEVKNAQRRLDRLTYNISQFEFLRNELQARMSAKGRTTQEKIAYHEARRPATAS